MDKNDIKIYLNENRDILQSLLEYIGLTHVRQIRQEYFSCGFPSSRRRDAINVFFNNNLTVKVWSRNEQINDIYGLVKYQMNCGFLQAVDIVSNFCGIKLGRSKLKNIERYMMKPKIEKKEYSRPKSNIIRYTEWYTRGAVDLFLKDGINEETQYFFEVGYDALDNAVIFPIKDYDGNIISYKQRTCIDNYIEKGIPKYMYSHRVDGRCYLFGYYENYWDIEKDEELIIVESEKSVMKLWGMGIRNCIATSKKRISEEQEIEVKRLGKKIILAYDNDVTEEEMIKICKKFKNASYIKDRWNLLEKKDSPVDCGKQTWEFLYNNKVEVKA